MRGATGGAASCGGFLAVKFRRWKRRVRVFGPGVRLSPAAGPIGDWRSCPPWFRETQALDPAAEGIQGISNIQHSMSNAEGRRKKGGEGGMGCCFGGRWMFHHIIKSEPHSNGGLGGIGGDHEDG